MCRPWEEAWVPLWLYLCWSLSPWPVMASNTWAYVSYKMFMLMHQWYTNTLISISKWKRTQKKCLFLRETTKLEARALSISQKLFTLLELCLRNSHFSFLSLHFFCPFIKLISLMWESNHYCQARITGLGPRQNRIEFHRWEPALFKVEHPYS